jgi:hypothetical protein
MENIFLDVLIPLLSNMHLKAALHLGQQEHELKPSRNVDTSSLTTLSIVATWYIYDCAASNYCCLDFSREDHGEF